MSEEARKDNRFIVACIPAFNEAKSLGAIIEKARMYVNEVIVCDDGSSDNTYTIAKEAGAYVLRHPKNMGYGATIKTLFLAAKEKNVDIMITLDSDGQHNPDDLPKFIDPILQEECDLVIGSRFLAGDHRIEVPRYRSVGIKMITRVTRTASYDNITDAQSGFRAYSKKALTNINLVHNGMSVSTEILIRARRKNLLIKEVPIKVKYDVDHPSTHNSVSHGMTVFYSVIQFIILHHPLLFYGLPGVILLIISAVLMNNALNLFVESRYVSTPLILLSSAAAVIGIIMFVSGTILFAIKTMLKKEP